MFSSLKIKTPWRAVLLFASALIFMPALAFAQTAPPATPIITVPPRPLTSVPPNQDGSSDSTLYSTGIPAPVPSTIQIALPSGSGGTTPPPATCTAGAAAAASNCTALTCPSGYSGTPSYTCACNSTGTGYVSTPSQTTVNASPTSYGCTALACTSGASEPTTDCPALTCPTGYNGTPSYTCACNTAGTGYVSTPTQAQVTSTPTSYGCTAQTCTPGSTQSCSITCSSSTPSGTQTCNSTGTAWGACSATCPVTCTAGSTTQSQTASCTAPQTVGGVSGGSTTFTQTRTQTESCPSGSTGAPSYAYTTWSPTVAATCAAPVCTPGATGPVCNALTCPLNYNGTPSPATSCEVCNSTGTGYNPAPITEADVSASPTSYGCTAQLCTPNATTSCNLSCNGGFTYAGGGTQTCNSTGTAESACTGTCPGFCGCSPPSPACSGPNAAHSQICSGLGSHPSTTACIDYGVAGQACTATWTCGGSSPYGLGDTCG